MFRYFKLLLDCDGPRKLDRLLVDIRAIDVDQIMTKERRRFSTEYETNVTFRESATF